MPLKPLKLLPNEWDYLFKKYGRRIPVPLLRALAKGESNLNPLSRGGSHWGLLQVGINNVLPSFNERRGTNYVAEDLLNANINVEIATDLLNRIAIAMSKHPDPNMKWNPRNPESVKLLLAGWNSGYSERAGLGRVASWLEARKIPVTHDNVFSYARRAGGTRFLQRERYDKKRRWQAKVADLYFHQPDAPTPGSSVLTPVLAIASILTIAYAVYRT